MAIYLDEQTRPYLERLINKQVEKSDKDFVAKRIKSALETDAARLDGISKCDHSFGKYIGEKDCCAKCGAFDVGMGESWTLVQPEKDSG